MKINELRSSGRKDEIEEPTFWIKQSESGLAKQVIELKPMKKDK